MMIGDKAKNLNFNSFTARLGMLLRLRGMTQATIAQRCRVSRVTVNRYLTGKTELKARDLLCMLKELGIDVEKVVNREIEKSFQARDRSFEPIVDDALDVVYQLDRKVKATIVEQIWWWSQSLKEPSLDNKRQRLLSFVRQLRAKGEVHELPTRM